MKYRPEIDGLRSVAVLPVILFHAGFSFFSGGYVGVDVFFVISGYLITTILIGEREAGTYSLLGFYERRARRILPALFFVLICTIPFAWRWIPPDPYEDFSRSLSYAAMFISNVHFLEKSSYFDVGAEFRPLLHTWSLAVEEQFYLLFPLVLWALGNFVQRKFLLVFFLLSAVSLGVAEWGWRNYPSENFFFSPSRLWELLAGSICAALLFGRTPMRNEIGAFAGLALILGSVIFFTDAIPFPSVYTVVPVLGTVLIILFAEKGTFVARLLSLPVLVGIGLISYSAYLWHQPLFVFARINSVAEPSPLLMGGMAIGSLLLAYLTWRYVESPFRRRNLLPNRAGLLTTSVIGIVLFAGFGTLGELKEGFPARHESKESPMLATWRMQLSKDRSHDRCVDKQTELEGGLCEIYVPEASTAKVALLGDSHARSILPAFEEVSKAHGVTVFGGIRAACPPLLGVYMAGGGTEAIVCSNITQHHATQIVLQEIETVFIAARWSLYATGGYGDDEADFALTQRAGGRVKTPEERLANFEAGLDKTVSFYRDAGIRVVLIAQVPQQWVLPENVLLQSVLQGLTPKLAREKFKSSFVKRVNYDTLVEDAERILAQVADRYDAEILSLTEYFAAGERYAWFLDDTVLYRDADHLSTIGALKVAPLIIDHYGPQ